MIERDEIQINLRFSRELLSASPSPSEYRLAL